MEVKLTAVVVVWMINKEKREGQRPVQGQGPYAEISQVARSRKSFYGLIVTLEVAWTLVIFRVVFRDRANIYTNSSETI